jgi:competence protein ComEC
MKYRLLTVKVIFLYICLFTIACILLWSPKKASVDSVTMLDVGQGDSFLITSKTGQQLLIDGGKDASVLEPLSNVMPLGDRTIDVVIATHPDADHIGGLPYVLSRYKVGMFLTSSVVSETEVFKDLYTTIQTKRIPSYYVRHGMNITLGPESTFSILFPDRDTAGWETNTASVIGRLDMNGASALFMGDSPISIESFLRTAIPKDIDVDMVKLGHHGSRTSSSEAFLKAVSPTLALISAGKNNDYGHPHKEVVDSLQRLSIPWVSTQDKGTVTFTPENGIWVER